MKLNTLLNINSISEPWSALTCPHLRITGLQYELISFPSPRGRTASSGTKDWFHCASLLPFPSATRIFPFFFHVIAAAGLASLATHVPTWTKQLNKFCLVILTGRIYLISAIELSILRNTYGRPEEYIFIWLNLFSSVWKVSNLINFSRRKLDGDQERQTAFSSYEWNCFCALKHTVFLSPAASSGFKRSATAVEIRCVWTRLRVSLKIINFPSPVLLAHIQYMPWSLLSGDPAFTVQ